MEPQAKPRRISTGFTVVMLLVGAFVIFIVGVGVGMSATKEPKVTTAAPTTTTLPDGPATTTAAPTTTAPYVPVPTDFSIEIIELERQCFGSAGCNVTYTINPAYLGTVETIKDYKVLYDITGGESPVTGNFTVTGDIVRHPEQELIQVPPGGVISATATRVLEQ